jgi:hypothetical protein
MLGDILLVIGVYGFLAGMLGIGWLLARLFP